MTRKDYQAIARAFHAAHPKPLTGTSAIPAMAAGVPEEEAFDRAEYDTWERCVVYIAAVMAADNPRFDRERFMKACETGADHTHRTGR